VRGVFAIGDAASVPWNGDELPMLSAPAMQEGRHVARLIRDEAAGRSPARRPFRYLDRGAMATIGRSSAVAQIGPLRRWGFPGWVAWLAVHIRYLVGFRNRLAVLSSWSWDYLRKDRAIRIIVQGDADPVAEAVHADAPVCVDEATPRRGSSEEVAEVA
jgi:NADH dehydrogenase